MLLGFHEKQEWRSVGLVKGFWKERFWLNRTNWTAYITGLRTCLFSRPEIFHILGAIGSGTEPDGKITTFAFCCKYHEE